MYNVLFSLRKTVCSRIIPTFTQNINNRQLASFHKLEYFSEIPFKILIFSHFLKMLNTYPCMYRPLPLGALVDLHLWSSNICFVRSNCGLFSREVRIIVSAGHGASGEGARFGISEKSFGFPQKIGWNPASCGDFLKEIPKS